ncbi:MAG: GntR family transcriptional regulator [Actinomycetes bacterium]
MPDGRRVPDGRLPTEHQLCEGHGISRKPVTWALSELAAEGVVIRHRRRGTFVNPHWLHGHRGGPELRVIAPDGCRSSPPPASWPRWRSLLALLASNGRRCWRTAWSPGMQAWAGPPVVRG